MNNKKRLTAGTVSRMKNHKLVAKLNKQNKVIMFMDFSISL
jgi:hypothetical protein